MDAKTKGTKVKVGKLKLFRFNIMVAGESGQGKTTFLKALLRKYVRGINISTLDGKTTKTVEISQIGSFIVDTDVGECEVFLHDTPGYGDYINNKDAIDLVHGYLDERHRRWRNLDVQAMTVEQRNNSDTRIHCAFYFIASHRMKAIDIQFISQLSPLVPIIPIIAKADTMTLEERHDFLCQVRSQLQTLKLVATCSITYDFMEDGDDFIPETSSPDIDSDSTQEREHEDQAYVNVGRSMMSDTSDREIAPEIGENYQNTTTSVSTEKEKEIETPGLPKIRNIFAIVCDNSPNNCREYPWGRLQIDDERHSDFRRLQRLMFEEGRHIHGMIDETQTRTISMYSQQKKPPITVIQQIYHHLNNLRAHIFSRHILIAIFLFMLFFSTGYFASRSFTVAGVSGHETYHTSRESCGFKPYPDQSIKAEMKFPSPTIHEKYGKPLKKSSEEPNKSDDTSFQDTVQFEQNTDIFADKYEKTKKVLKFIFSNMFHPRE